MLRRGRRRADPAGAGHADAGDPGPRHAGLPDRQGGGPPLAARRRRPTPPRWPARAIDPRPADRADGDAPGTADLGARQRAGSCAAAAADYAKRNDGAPDPTSRWRARTCAPGSTPTTRRSTRPRTSARGEARARGRRRARASRRRATLRRSAARPAPGGGGGATTRHHRQGVEGAREGAQVRRSTARGPVHARAASCRPHGGPGGREHRTSGTRRCRPAASATTTSLALQVRRTPARSTSTTTATRRRSSTRRSGRFRRSSASTRCGRSRTTSTTCTSTSGSGEGVGGAGGGAAGPLQHDALLEVKLVDWNAPSPTGFGGRLRRRRAGGIPFGPPDPKIAATDLRRCSTA